VCVFQASLKQIWIIFSQNCVVLLVNSLRQALNVYELSSWTACPLNMGRTGCPETSVTDYQSMLSNIPEKQRSIIKFDSKFWRSCERASRLKITRCTNFSNLFLEWNSTCFGQFLCPSSGTSHCTHSNGIYYRGLLTACGQHQDGTPS
jgi:hypothetical protein